MKHGSRMFGMKRMKHNLWWSRKGAGAGGVTAMMTEEFCKVVEIKKVNRVMTGVTIFVEDMRRLIYGYASRCGRRFEEKRSLYE